MATKVRNRKDGEVKEVTMQCLCNGHRPYSGADSGPSALRQRMGASSANVFSFSATTARQRGQEQPDKWLIIATPEEHNYDPFVDSKFHVDVRLRRNKKQQVIANLLAGISAGLIFASIRQSGIAGVIGRDICKIHANEHRRLLGWRSPLATCLTFWRRKRQKQQCAVLQI